MKRYINVENSVEIEYPEDWEVIENEMGVLVMFMSPLNKRKAKFCPRIFLRRSWVL